MARSRTSSSGRAPGAAGDTSSPSSARSTPTAARARRARSDVTAELAARLADALERLRGLPPSDGFDGRVPEALVAAGLHAAPVPRDAGGLGIGLREAVEVLAALGAVDGSVALGFAMHLHVVGSMVESEAWPVGLREAVYRAIVDDGALLNSAATEEGTGSPARGGLPATRAIRDGDVYRLTGEKSWTTWLPALRLALVTATIGEGPDVGTFLVDMAGRGVERLPAFDALGMQASASGRLRLSDALVRADRLVARRTPSGPDPRGPAPAAWFGCCVAGTYLGVGEGARRAVVAWAVDRRPGDGSTAVADLPTVQVRLGRIDAALRAARIVVLDVAGRWDASPSGERGRLLGDVSLAKLGATNAAAQATDEALRIAGGPGFLAGPLERAFRDARAGLINPPLEDVALQGFARALVDRERARR